MSEPFPASERTVPCDLCDGTRFELLSDRDRGGGPLRSCVCCTCGLVSHETIPSAAELNDYYERKYRSEYHGELVPSSRRVLREWKRAEPLARLLGQHLRPGSRVFEVGAGIGCLVKQLQLAGYDASGIEPGRGFQRFSREHLRAPVIYGFLHDVPTEARFDAVLLVHVLEHFRSPATALRQVRGLLRPGGTLYIEVPDFGAPHAAPGKLFHTAHIYNFTRDTLTMLVNRCGFVVDRLFSETDEKCVRMLVRPADNVAVQIDPDSHARTLAAFTRYNAWTYHLRRQYFEQRLRSFAWQTTARPWARLRVARILARCAAA